MASSIDLSATLPDAPLPSPEARERHMAAALARFDAQRRPDAPPIRLSGPVRRRPWLSNTSRAAIAACLVLAAATPVAWHVVQESRGVAVSAPEPATPRKAGPGEAGREGPAATVAVEAAPEAPVVIRPEDAPPARAAEAGTRPAAQAQQQAPASSVSEGEPELRVASQEAARPAPPTAVAPEPSGAPSPAKKAKAAPRSYHPPGAHVASAPVPMPHGVAPPARMSTLMGPVESRPMLPDPRGREEAVGRDQFAGAEANSFRSVQEAPVSTFSIDVDTASYSFVRASLSRNVLPQQAAVRVEELVNYFPYDYPAPESPDRPFRTTVDVFPSPWAEGRKVVRIGVKGYALPATARPRANLVFLIDTSGSMDAPNRLPLVKQSLAMLVGELDARDRVAIVTYAGEAGTALEPTPASDRAKILAAIERLGAGGSTAGGEGIRQAYALAQRSYDGAAVNRVILATDGDFNVGITNREELKSFVERERGKGIFLSVLGFGMGNYNDALMQALAQNGNGAAAYIDTIAEARKVMVEEATSTLFPIAKDVKIQVEFNPATVQEYRLIGYETRLLKREDFNNDKVDAGEVGSGQSVTALYEIVPVGAPSVAGEMRYARTEPARAAPDPNATEYAFVKIRYKLPKSETSELISTPVEKAQETAGFDAAPADARFATAVAAFGEILRGGRHMGRFGYDDVIRIASAARGPDPYGYRTEFVQLVRGAKTAASLRPASR